MYLSLFGTAVYVVTEEKYAEAKKAEERKRAAQEKADQEAALKEQEEIRKKYEALREGATEDIISFIDKVDEALTVAQIKTEWEKCDLLRYFPDLDVLIQNAEKGVRLRGEDEATLKGLKSLIHKQLNL